MLYLLAASMGYFLGCSNMALYLSKWKKVDLKGNGSGNLGASNTAMLMGMVPAVLVAVHDIGKSVLAVMLAKWLFPELEYAGPVAGLASVMGHIFPFYIRFRGGKGLASYFGMTLALNWKLALTIFVLGLALTLITDYIVSATTLTILWAPAYLGISTHNWILVLILLAGTAVIAYKHRENYMRIINGTEFRVRSVLRKKHNDDRS